MDDLEAGKQDDVFLKIYNASQAAQGLRDASVFSPYLRNTYQSLQKLCEPLSDFLKNFNAEKPFTRNQTLTFYTLYRNFKTIFLAETNSFPAYFVTQKKAFDTLTLLENGEALFPENLVQKVPEALFDIREAGKCIAFELPTAAGYRIMRATESVLRKYYHQVTGNPAAPKIRNMMIYVRTMQKAGKGDPKVLTTIEHISSLHRNPLMHPEDVLSMDEALALKGIAISAISAMIVHLPVPALTTSNATGP